jgi:hypothetical protein
MKYLKSKVSGILFNDVDLLPIWRILLCPTNFCPYLCDMLFLVKTLKKGFKVELQKFSSPKLTSQDRLTKELHLFAQFIKQRKIIFACHPAPRTLLGLNGLTFS